MRSACLVLVAAAALLTSCAPQGKQPSQAKAQFLNTPDSLERALPFSQAVRAGDLLFLAGQIGDDPATGKPAAGGIKAEARQALEHIRTILERNGSSLADVVKCTVFLADIAEWGAFNEIYKQFFRQPYPARSALGSSGLALGARVEVECIAYVPRASD